MERRQDQTEMTVEAAELNGTDYFSAELKAQRTKRGWTQTELGGNIGFSTSWVSDVERGDKLPSQDFAERCDTAFDLPGTFVRFHEIAKRMALPSYFAPVISFESSAVKITGWELGSVPGLLQTENYARALIQAARPYDPPEVTERLVQVRMERQAVLARDHPPKIWYALDESILRRLVGSAEIMAEQIAHLEAALTRPGLVLQVLPFDAGDHAATEGPVTLYEFADKPSVCYAECKRGGRLVEDRAEVAELTTALDLVRSNALSPRATLDLLAKYRERVT